MKLFRQLKRYFRDAFKSVFRNFPLSLASISCITITLIVVAASIIITYNVENFAESIRKNNLLAQSHKPSKDERMHFISSVNSYLGILKIYKTKLKQVYLPVIKSIIVESVPDIS